MTSCTRQVLDLTEQDRVDHIILLWDLQISLLVFLKIILQPRVLVHNMNIVSAVQQCVEVLQSIC